MKRKEENPLKKGLSGYNPVSINFKKLQGRNRNFSLIDFHLFEFILVMHVEFNGEFHHSYKDISWDTGIAESTVKSRVKYLMGLGIIDRKTKPVSAKTKFAKSHFKILPEGILNYLAEIYDPQGEEYEMTKQYYVTLNELTKANKPIHSISAEQVKEQEITVSSSINEKHNIQSSSEETISSSMERKKQPVKKEPEEAEVLLINKKQREVVSQYKDYMEFANDIIQGNIDSLITLSTEKEMSLFKCLNEEKNYAYLESGIKDQFRKKQIICRLTEKYPFLNITNKPEGNLASAAQIAYLQKLFTDKLPMADSAKEVNAVLGRANLSGKHVKVLIEDLKSDSISL
jgi:DNA-binding Lrp family transcriptional regulator